MKKVLLALTIVAMMAASASALNVLGGKLGVGVEMIDLDGMGTNPFVSLDFGAIQARAGVTVTNTPKTGDETGSGKAFDDSTTGLTGSVLYTLWSGNWAPYVGGRLAWQNAIVNIGSDTAQARTITTSLSVPVGVKWMVLNNVNFYVEMDALNMTTVMLSNVDKDVTTGGTTTTWFGTSARLGAVLYL